MTSTVGLFFGPLANTLATRFGSRPVVMAGGIVTSIGFFATALAPNIYVLFVTYGFLIGFGFSLAISPMMVIPVYYFKERPSLAIGLAYTGTGIGGIVLPILLQYLAEAYSWRGAAIVMSAASLNICVCGAVVRPLQEHEVYDGSSEEDIDVAFLRDQGNGVTEELCLNRAEGSGGSPGVTRIKSAPQDGSALHIASGHLKSAVVGVGSLSNSEGTYALTAWGGGSLAGALGAGITLFKFPKIDALIVIIAETTICGCSLILITLVSSECYAVLVMCFVVGFTVDPHNYLMQLVHKSMAFGHRLESPIFKWSSPHTDEYWHYPAAVTKELKDESFRPNSIMN
ncbi:uncharacterized protein LOC135483877 [Lineus longissimus]|uniref:uncharacterized protein LOC135483877 n=1 Tax=Lineus longissimus TaxID=88925 RepID=UPI00315DE87A